MAALTVQPSLRREQMESLHELGFVERRENVISLGPPGVGRTHMAISLAIAAAQRIRTAEFVASRPIRSRRRLVWEIRPT
jgi:DNA replication protein DnaC